MGKGKEEHTRKGDMHKEKDTRRDREAHKQNGRTSKRQSDMRDKYTETETLVYIFMKREGETGRERRKRLRRGDERGERGSDGEIKEGSKANIGMQTGARTG